MAGTTTHQTHKSLKDRLPERSRLLLLSFVVGVCAGLAAVLLTTCIDASRTKVRRGVPMRTQAEIDAYNAIARRVMAEEGVGLDRLDEASRLIPPADRADWVHFDPSGSAVLARCAAQAIRGAMDERKEG